MTEITIVNLRNCPGFGSLKGDIRIDRMTSLGNPFPIGSCTENGVGKVYSRKSCIDRYEKYVSYAEQVDVSGKKYDGMKVRQAIKKIREEIREHPEMNYRLGCWCSPLRCHGEILKNRILDGCV